MSRRYVSVTIQMIAEDGDEPQRFAERLQRAAGRHAAGLPGDPGELDVRVAVGDEIEVTARGFAVAWKDTEPVATAEYEPSACPSK